jgi:predicted TIM-barrel fold metal-dependent hydrolase
MPVTLTRIDLTAHLAALICLFSKSHDCGQVVAHLGRFGFREGRAFTRWNL